VRSSFSSSCRAGLGQSPDPITSVSDPQIRKLLSGQEKHELPWLRQGRKYWNVDLNGLRTCIPDKRRSTLPDWFEGAVAIEPIFEPGSPSDLNNPRKAAWRGKVCFDITEKVLKLSIGVEVPVEIQSSLESFLRDYPAKKPTALIVMRFGKTLAHRKITQGIEKTLAPFGIAAVRADHKEYHQDLFSNVLTYIYGCRFGISVFERIEGDDFNNVSLEVGYMLALSKPVCILKDRTLRTMPTDLMGKRYRPFDPLSPSTTIPSELEKWCRDRGFTP